MMIYILMSGMEGWINLISESANGMSIHYKCNQRSYAIKSQWVNVV